MGVTFSRRVDLILVKDDANEIERERHSYIAMSFVPEPVGYPAGADRLRLEAGQSIDITIDVSNERWGLRQASVLDYGEFYRKVEAGEYQLTFNVGVYNEVADTSEEITSNHVRMLLNKDLEKSKLSTKCGQ
jgi:hypothetical protein